MAVCDSASSRLSVEWTDSKSRGNSMPLIASGARFSEKVSVIGAHKKGELTTLATRKIGPGRIFGRIWETTGIQSSLHTLLSNRKFRFDVQSAIWLTVVHRLLEPGSDRAADKWRHDYWLPGVEDLSLHQLYRAMAWLGEELPEAAQAHQTPFAPRCVKDLIEENLFRQKRDLFSDLVLAFFDTTSLYFVGQGGQTLGKHGYSKDRRPDCKQLVVGLVLDGQGRPLCCELWPGNTTDVKTLIPLVERLRHRFRIRRICIVADRGMISQETISELEKTDFIEYILGARMRNQKEVTEEVLSRAGRYRIIHPKRVHSKDPSPLKVKEVAVDDRRYIVCHNEDQARKDAADREQIVQKLQENLMRGDKSLVGNKGFRKYLKTTESNFSFDFEKLESERRFDGKWVLRTNSTLTSAEVALTYKQLWKVESLFRTVKSILQTRPIYHKRDETIRGHVFCSFLALVMMRELQDRMAERGFQDAEWADVLRDLDNLSETDVRTHDGTRFSIRSAVKGWCGKTFQACGVALPPTLRLLREVDEPHT